MVRYRNLDGSLPQSMRSVLKWAVTDRLAGRRAPNRAPYAPPRNPNDGSELRANSSEPLLTWIGHATWVIQLGGANLVVDPIWARAISGVIPRNGEPGVAMEHLPNLDAVLVTHNHRDHMDAPTLRQLRHARRAVVPAGLGAQMRSLGYDEIVELQWWQSTQVGGARVTLVPSQHWSRRGMADTNESLWGGFVVEADGKRVYHSGDTAYFDGFKLIADRVGPPSVALLPIGAYEPEWFMRKQHMNPEDALQAARDLRAEHVLPMHWGTYQLTDEWLGEPPERFMRIVSKDEQMRGRVTLIPIGGMHRF